MSRYHLSPSWTLQASPLKILSVVVGGVSPPTQSVGACCFTFLLSGTVASFVPTLFGCFLGIPFLYFFSFFKMLFVTCSSSFCFCGGGGGVSKLLTPDTCVCYSGDNSSASRDSYGSRSTTNNCKVMWSRKVVGVYSSGGTDSI